MFAGFLVALAVTAPLLEGRSIEEAMRVLGIVIGAAIVVAMGAWDDKKELGPFPQLTAQVAAALVAVSFGIVIDKVTNPLGTPFENSLLYFPTPVAIGITILWIMGAMNAINFIDGIDGLASGITAIAALVLAIHSLQMGQYSVAVLPLALAGCTLGFLPHNFFPAKLTMGTSGAMFLGYAIGTMSIVGGTKAATLLLVLGIPIVDAGWIIIRRVAAGRSPFRGDRTHLHYRLLDMGLTTPQIVVIMYLLSGSLGALALLISSRVLKLYTILGMIALMIGVLALIAQRTMGRGADNEKSGDS
ncbi:MAG: glycosyl transferase family 4 [Dehalococcoidia bacterium]|nr:glycosyl transferase family 4 [Dehalococcoidia bacterium]